jgi:hypothetical protein
MITKRWTPPVATTRKERFLLKRLTRTQKLFAFLRLHRHELFNDAFQEELQGMYRTTGAGSEPVPSAVLCLGLLLQAYTGVSDAEARHNVCYEELFIIVPTGHSVAAMTALNGMPSRRALSLAASSTHRALGVSARRAHALAELAESCSPPARSQVLEADSRAAADSAAALRRSSARTLRPRLSDVTD